MSLAENKCTVYHGTNLFAAKIIYYYGIWLDVQRLLTDFGRGFYVTFNLEQAKKWAKVRSRQFQMSPEILNRLKISKDDYFNHPDTKIPVYLSFNLDLTRLHQLNGKIFPLPRDPLWLKYKNEWEFFVTRCRKGKRHIFDYVYGPIGGGHLTDFTKIKVSKSKEQLSFNSAKAIDCLSETKIHFIPLENQLMNRNDGIVFESLRSQKEMHTVYHMFWQELHNELKKIGDFSSRQTNQIIKESWMTQDLIPILLHESPAYWAFSLVYGTERLWYKEFEEYMMSK